MLRNPSKTICIINALCFQSFFLNRKYYNELGAKYIIYYILYYILYGWLTPLKKLHKISELHTRFLHKQNKLLNLIIKKTSRQVMSLDLLKIGQKKTKIVNGKQVVKSLKGQNSQEFDWFIQTKGNIQEGVFLKSINGTLWLVFPGKKGMFHSLNPSLGIMIKTMLLIKLFVINKFLMVIFFL